VSARRDGYVANLLGGRDLNSDDTKGAARPSTPKTGALTFDLIGNYQNDKPAGTSFKSIAYRPTDPATGAVLGAAGRNSGAALAPGAGFRRREGARARPRVWGVTGLERWISAIGFALTSISAYRRSTRSKIFDADGLSLPVLTAAEDARGRQASQELRLRYERGPLTAFVGGSYFHESGSQRTPAQFDERAALARLTGQLAGPIPGRPATDPDARGLARQYGLHRSAPSGSRAELWRRAGRPAGAGDRREPETRTWRDQHQFLAHQCHRRLRRCDDQTVGQFRVGAGVRYSHDDKTQPFHRSHAQRSLHPGRFHRRDDPAGGRPHRAAPSAGSTRCRFHSTFRRLSGAAVRPRGSSPLRATARSNRPTSATMGSPGA
jgi:iron complex outermembrane receptor protein